MEAKVSGRIVPLFIKDYQQVKKG
ncbi:MAG: hypothetical protein ACMUEM_04215 [Flavobacteriales bacterium AspAUS03]